MDASFDFSSVSGSVVFLEYSVTFVNVVRDGVYKPFPKAEMNGDRYSSPKKKAPYVSALD